MESQRIEKMKIKEYLKTHTDYNCFQIVTESGDKWTDILTKEEVLNLFGNAEIKDTETNCEEFMYLLILFIADKDFKE